VANKIRNVFISHVHEDDAVLQGLKDLLDKNGYQIRDGSIDSSKPNDANNEDYIKSQILAPRIQWASVFVVLISPNTSQSPWVNWEIEYAQSLGKRIVGIYAHGEVGAELPPAFEKYGEALVGWQSDRLMGAIAGTVNDWCEPGSEASRNPHWEVVRYSCA
jgi:hypothetical protein